jgi:hypothetical protein
VAQAPFFGHVVNGFASVALFATDTCVVRCDKPGQKQQKDEPGNQTGP